MQHNSTVIQPHEYADQLFSSFTKKNRKGKRKADTQNLTDNILDVQEVELSCQCTKKNFNIPYNSNGCLRCTSQDSAYYIQNFSESLLAFYIQN